MFCSKKRVLKIWSLFLPWNPAIQIVEPITQSDKSLGNAVLKPDLTDGGGRPQAQGAERPQPRDRHAAGPPTTRRTVSRNEAEPQPEHRRLHASAPFFQQARTKYRYKRGTCGCRPNRKYNQGRKHIPHHTLHTMLSRTHHDDPHRTRKPPPNPRQTQPAHPGKQKRRRLTPMSCRALPPCLRTKALSRTAPCTAPSP